MKLLRTIHGIAGLVTGLVILVVALSGCFYAFQKEIREKVYPDLIFVNPTSAGSPLTLDSIRSIAETAYPHSPIREIVVEAAPDRSVKVYTHDLHLLYINPYEGNVLAIQDREKDPFLLAWQLHTSLSAGKPGGRIVAAATLAILPLILSGIILWWPRKWRNLRHSLRLPLTGKWTAVNFQWHKNGGFLSSILLVPIVCSGLVMSYRWAEDALYFMTASASKDRELPQPLVTGQKEDVLEKMRHLVLQSYPTHREAAISFPSSRQGVYTYRVRYHDAVNTHHVLYFNPTDASLLKAKEYETTSTGDKWRAANYNIHSGKILGLPGRIAAFLATLFCAFLVISGTIMWFKRNNRSKRIPKRVKSKESVLRRNE